MANFAFIFSWQALNSFINGKLCINLFMANFQKIYITFATQTLFPWLVNFAMFSTHGYGNDQRTAYFAQYVL